ncbi:MAG: serine/threonine protein kinase [Planctomycetota bacterium]
MNDQRDMLFLKIAVKNEMLTAEQAEQVLAAVEKRRELGVVRTPAEIALEKQFLTAAQVEAVEGALRASLPPERIGGFQILERIGAGAVGTVYKARQLSLDKVVALKVLNQSLSKNPKFVEQFIREAKAVGRLNHPHIVHAIDAGEADGYDYLAMEYVPGETLKKRVETRQRLPEAEVLEIARAATQGLVNAHQNGLLHRDMKPDNILLGPEGQIKIADLGLAMPLNDAQVQAVEHKRMGTPFYLSPEQATGKSVDERSDLYALGATLYHALAGKPLFTGKTVKEILTKQVHQEPVSLTAAGVSVSKATEALVMKLLAKDPAQRFQTAEGLLEAILAAEGQLAPARSAETQRPAPRSRRPVATDAGSRPARTERSVRQEALGVGATSHPYVRRKTGAYTMAGAIGGGAVALVLVLMAVSRNRAEGTSDAAIEAADQAALEQVDQSLIETRRKLWREEIEKTDREVADNLAGLLTRTSKNSERLRGLNHMLSKNLVSSSAPLIMAEIDKILGAEAAMVTAPIDQAIAKADELRAQGKLRDAISTIDAIPQEIQNLPDNARRLKIYVDAVQAEIDQRWAKDYAEFEAARKAKDFERAIAALDRATDYADSQTSSDIARSRTEALEQKAAHEEVERGKLLVAEFDRYKSVVGKYRAFAVERDFKTCINEALTLQAEITTEAVRKQLEQDIEAFELLNNFVQDAVKQMIARGEADKTVLLKLKDKQRMEGKVLRADTTSVWLTVTRGGGSAEVPVELERITDDTLFPLVEERHGAKSPAYLVPLGVLFSYRGLYDVAGQHFGLAASNGFSADAWTEKLEWLRKNLGG